MQSSEIHERLRSCIFHPTETSGGDGGVPNTDHGYLGDERHKSGISVALVCHHDCRPVQVKINIYRRLGGQQIIHLTYLGILYMMV